MVSTVHNSAGGAKYTTSFSFDLFKIVVGFLLLVWILSVFYHVDSTSENLSSPFLRWFMLIFNDPRFE